MLVALKCAGLLTALLRAILRTTLSVDRTCYENLGVNCLMHVFRFGLNNPREFGADDLFVEYFKSDLLALVCHQRLGRRVSITRSSTSAFLLTTHVLPEPRVPHSLFCWRCALYGTRLRKVGLAPP
jgi:hypothetical protein